MNKNTFDILKADLIRHEGRVGYLYLDHLGFKTGGVGHLITQADGVYLDAPVETNIADCCIDRWFDEDIKKAIIDCVKLFNNFDNLPDKCQCILINMAFNLGRTRLSKFKKLIAAIDDNDYIEAGRQMQDSKWYRQVKSRAKELVKRMQEVEL